MKRAGLVVGMVVIAMTGDAWSARAAAQLPGMPVWNSPKGGTGLLIAGDAGIPDSIGGNGTTWAGRAALGLQALTLSATLGVRKPEAATSSITEYGGTAAFRLIGGSLIPVSVNLQGGLARYIASSIANTRGTAAIGFAIDVPVPGISIEPWVAPGLRIYHVGAHTLVVSGLSTQIAAQTNNVFGVAGGLTVGFGMFGLHAAMDYEKIPGGGHTTTLGVGAHLDIRPTLGL